jgi:hypothetical protein
LRVHDYGYDWRLSPHLLSKKLLQFLSKLPCNEPISGRKGATVIAHSLGGLITRHAVNQRPDLFAGVIYAGVPQHCVNILGPFRNGDEVLLSSRVLTAQVNFTLRTSFVLLPESGHCFIDKETKEEYPVNFFDPKDWKEYAFSPCIAPCLPALSAPEPRRSLLGSISHNLPGLPGKKSSPLSATISAAQKSEEAVINEKDPVGMQMDSQANNTNTTCTIPLPEAQAYLERTLAQTLTFKRELAYRPEHGNANAYPPISILYSTSTPTVYGAKVSGRDGIRRADAYDNLAFASGDGVVLARAAMAPRGYKVVPNGRMKTERGHVGLLGDLEAVGRCLRAIMKARTEGVGLGVATEVARIEC